MTAAQYERMHQPKEDVDVNPVTTFILLLVAPYILFFGLLMLLTGQFDLPLVYTSVIQVSGTVYIKAWVIGSFLLAVTGTVLLSGYRTKTYVVEQITRKQTRQSPTPTLQQTAHFSIEELPSDQARTPSRHIELERILDDAENGTPLK